VLEGNTPRFPRTKIVPSATMLTRRLTGTTVGSGSPQHTPKACARQRKRTRAHTTISSGEQAGEIFYPTEVLAKLA